MEDMSRERKIQGQRDHYSSSYRKSSKRDPDPGVPLRSLEEPQSPRRPAGQQPSVPAGDGKDWRYKEEDAAYWQERGAAESGDNKSWGTGERHRKGKRAEHEATYPQTHRERAGSDADGGTLSRRSGRERGDKEQWEGRPRGPADNQNRGSNSSIQDPGCNGNAAPGGVKKAPITPGPWKVPSSAKMQSQVDPAYADI